MPRHHSSILRIPGNGQVCGFPVRDLVLGSKPISSFTTLDKTMFVQYLSSDKCQRRLKPGFFSPPKAHWFFLLPANIILLFLMIHLCRMRQRKYTGFQEKQTFNPFQLKFAYGLYLGINDSDSQQGVRHPHSR